MKIFHTTAIVSSFLFILGATQAVNATPPQPMGNAASQDHLVLVKDGHRGGHGHYRGHHRGHHGGYGHHGWRGGGGYYGPGIGLGVYGAPSYYGKKCYWNNFGQRVCYRQF